MNVECCIHNFIFFLHKFGFILSLKGTPIHSYIIKLLTSLLVALEYKMRFLKRKIITRRGKGMECNWLQLNFNQNTKVWSLESNDLYCGSRVCGGPSPTCQSTTNPRGAPLGTVRTVIMGTGGSCSDYIGLQLATLGFPKLATLFGWLLNLPTTCNHSFLIQGMADETFPSPHIHVRRLSHIVPYLQLVETTDKSSWHTI